jgi:hypothetical protein
VKAHRIRSTSRSVCLWWSRAYPFQLSVDETLRDLANNGYSSVVAIGRAGEDGDRLASRCAFFSVKSVRMRSLRPGAAHCSVLEGKRLSESELALGRACSPLLLSGCR